jgi:hypothetical protein
MITARDVYNERCQVESEILGGQSRMEFLMAKLRLGSEISSIMPIA